QDNFKKALEEDYYLGPVYISKYDLPFISISLPILDENNTQVGVLASEVDLSPMWGAVAKIKVKETGYVYVVDQDGKLIAYKDVNLVKKNLALNQIQGVKNFFNNIRQPETYLSFNNEKVIGNWKSVDATGWGVIVELPMKELFQDAEITNKGFKITGKKITPLVTSIRNTRIKPKIRVKKKLREPRIIEKTVSSPSMILVISITYVCTSTPTPTGTTTPTPTPTTTPPPFDLLTIGVIGGLGVVIIVLIVLLFRKK
ncbi:MAG: hypothetical protein ThorAB25_18350, partial [Candidatus Thorarchaeota archaeon AB_25]